MFLMFCTPRPLSGSIARTTPVVFMTTSLCPTRKPNFD